MYASFLHCILQTAHQLFRFPTFYWSDETIYRCDANLHPMCWVKVGTGAEHGSGWLICPSECFERNARLPVMGSSSETGKLCVRHSSPPLEVFLVYFREQRGDVLLKYLMPNILTNPSKMWQSGDLWEQQETFMMRVKVNETRNCMLQPSSQISIFLLPLEKPTAINWYIAQWVLWLS
jgi:hypothetical protein